MDAVQGVPVEDAPAGGLPDQFAPAGVDLIGEFAHEIEENFRAAEHEAGGSPFKIPARQADLVPGGRQDAQQRDGFQVGQVVAVQK